MTAVFSVLGLLNWVEHLQAPAVTSAMSKVSTLLLLKCPEIFILKKKKGSQ